MELLAESEMRVVSKPWGREVWWAVTDRYVGKRIEVTAEHALSLQYHERKMETLYFLEGEARLQVGDEWQSVRPGQAITLKPGTVHRIEAVTNVVLFEVSTPEVDDVIRLEDRYGRGTEASR